jgi:hypothetical protein
MSSLPLVPIALPGQEVFHPPVLLYERKKRKEKKRNMTLLLV